MYRRTVVTCAAGRAEITLTVDGDKQLTEFDMDHLFGFWEQLATLGVKPNLNKLAKNIETKTPEVTVDGSSTLKSGDATVTLEIKLSHFYGATEVQLNNTLGVLLGWLRATTNNIARIRRQKETFKYLSYFMAAMVAIDSASKLVDYITGRNASTTSSPTGKHDTGEYTGQEPTGFPFTSSLLASLAQYPAYYNFLPIGDGDLDFLTSLDDAQKRSNP